jgi:hypothetical protein
MNRAERRDLVDGMAPLPRGEVASCLVDRAPTPVRRRVFEPGVPSQGHLALRNGG